MIDLSPESATAIGAAIGTCLGTAIAVVIGMLKAFSKGVSKGNKVDEEVQNRVNAVLEPFFVNQKEQTRIIQQSVSVLDSFLKNQADQNTAFLKNQSEQTLILGKLSLIVEYRDADIKEMHRQNQSKMDEIKENQRDILGEVRRFVETFKAGQ